MSETLGKSQILAVRQRRTELVTCPLLAGKVRVGAMTARDRDNFEAALVVADGNKRKTDFTNFRAKLVARTVIDDDGKRIFADEDADALGELEAADIQPIFEVAQRLNGFSQADVDELTKNSSAAPSGASSSV